MPRRHKSPKQKSSPREVEQESASAQRLQKVLAAAGVASRRDCEELIREGRVEVDRQVVTELGTRVDPVGQEIRVDGEPIRKPKRVYFALNKPADIVCTNHDPSGRTRVIDLVPSDERVFAVGRLDRASEGLILVTNDGNFANHITHPRYGVEKTYLVRVAGRPGPEELAKLRRGVHLAEGFCKVESVVVKSRHKQSSDLLIVLDEGRNREIRRILAKVGHKVVKLKRIAVGNLKLGALEAGEWRKLTAAEIDALLAISRQKRKDKKKAPPRDISTEEVVDTAKVSREARMKKGALKAEGSKDTPLSPALPPAKTSVKPPNAKSIAERLLKGEDFEDDEDFDDELLSDDSDGDFGDDDGDDLIEQTVIREEIRDDRRPPRSGPAPRGEVLEFDEDSPPPLQPRKVREDRSAGKSERPVRSDKPLRTEPRTSHRRRGDETGKPGQNFRRGQRHRQQEDFGAPRGERSDQRRSKTSAEKTPQPKRPGKLVADRPQEDRGARGKYPGKSFGKGKKYEGGGRGAKTIFGKRVKKKDRGRSSGGSTRGSGGSTRP
jgi:23S rRNA pseudouridine2605 synthase